MWDIDAIISQHNQYALDEMMSTLRVEVVQSPQPTNWSLSVLAEKLRTGPPLLTALLDQFTSVEVMCGFLELIMRYLPEHETDILRERGNQRLYRFCQLFGRRYFPLPAYAWDTSIDEFVHSMPVSLLGFSYTAYHDLNFRPGYVLLLSLLIYPYEGDERDEENDKVPFNPFDPMKNMDLRNGTYKPAASDIKWLKELVAGLGIGGQWIAPIGFNVIKRGVNTIELVEALDTLEAREMVLRTTIVAEKAGIKIKAKRNGRTAEEKLNGARVALIDAATQLVGPEVASLILAQGWDWKHIHELTDGTVYDGAGDFADWVFRSTGCTVLDSNYEDCGYTEGDMDPHFAWSKTNVNILTKEMPKVRQIRERIDNVVQFIEGDPAARFSELLELLRSKPAVKRKLKKLHGEDELEHYVQLEEVQDEEEDDDE